MPVKKWKRFAAFTAAACLLVVPATVLAQAIVLIAISAVIVGPNPMNSYEFCAVNTTDERVNKVFRFAYSGSSRVVQDAVVLELDPNEVGCESYLPPGPGVISEVIPVPPVVAEAMRTGQPGLPPGLRKIPTQIWLLDATTGARTSLVGHIDHCGNRDRLNIVERR